LHYFPQKIKSVEASIRSFKSDIALLQLETKIDEKGFSPMIIGEKIYSDKEKAGEALLKFCENAANLNGENISSYRGFEMSLHFSTLGSNIELELKGNAIHRAVLGTDVYGNIRRINNVLDGISERLSSAESGLGNINQQIENTENETTKPFPQEAELAEKTARLAELDASLNLDNSSEDAPEEVYGNNPKEMEEIHGFESKNPEKNRSILEALKPKFAPPMPSSDRNLLSAEL
jgi:hypothetical protein